MERFWNIFWKAFGAVVIVLIIVGVAGGAITRSSDFTSTVVRQTLAIALGICGVIGFLVIPVQMYFEDKSRKEKARVIE